MDDTYKFTVSAEPTETGVLDRQNIEFAAMGVVLKASSGCPMPWSLRSQELCWSCSSPPF